MAKRNVDLILPLNEKKGDTSSSGSDYDFSNFIPATNNDHKLISLTKAKSLKSRNHVPTMQAVEELFDSVS